MKAGFDNIYDVEDVANFKLNLERLAESDATKKRSYLKLLRK